jgi:dihydropteroate synthase
MGVLNLTTDSFSDGGRFNDPNRALDRVLELEEQGADIVDVGAESTRPGSHRITAEEEWLRLSPFLELLVKGNVRVPISLDTYKSEIAERALQYGVEIFNDPSGLTFDPKLAKVAANGNAGLILNHMTGQPETWSTLPPMPDPLGTIARELQATVNRARHAGVEPGRIVIDPGLGFGKRKQQSVEILARLKELAKLDYPILVGPSRKSFLAQSSEGGTLFATAAAVTAAVLNGAHIVRVHDVKEMHTVVQVAEEIARAAVPKPAPNMDDRMVVRAHTRTGPNPEADRPRPTRPPIGKPPVEQPILPAAPAAQPRPAPLGRDFRPGQGDGAGKDRFKPAGPKRPFDGGARREDKPPRRQDRDKFRPAAPPASGPPRSRPDDDRSRPAGFRPGFKPKPPGFKPSGPKRSFDRGTDRGAGPRGDRPGKGSSGPPKRPFRKRP